jgi:hypothetical protein
MGLRMQKWAWTALLVTLGVVGASAQACSSSSSGSASCADDPNTCGAGTTCWATDSVPHMGCLPSVAGKNPHDSCKNTIGKPTCSDHQSCVEIVSGFGGCLQYCDDAKPNRGCPPIETCFDLHAGPTADSPIIHVCAVPAEDAGVDAGTVEDSSGIRDVRTELPI